MTTFYTRRGDEGYTDLLGARVPKHHPRTEFIGTLDETTSQIGMARAHAISERTTALLVAVQRDLYTMMAELAFVGDVLLERYRIGSEHLERIESETDALAAAVPLAREFILPGDTLSGAALDLARAVTRRAERVGVELLHSGEIENATAIAYLNRLSSLLFVLGRYEDQLAGVQPKQAKTLD
jgi:cob(I)alamin adenosyltransferase